MKAFPSAILVAIIVCSSCTVKENRQECPCDVTVMTDGNIHKGHQGDLKLSVFVNQLALKTIYRQPMKIGDFLDGKCMIQVPKGWFNVSVVGGKSANMTFVKDTLLLIPCGSQCDSICAFSQNCYAYTDDDDMIVKGSLDKQFCTVVITVKDKYGYDIDADIIFKGEVDGMNIMTLEPHAGTFLYEVSTADSGQYEARLPRQSDSSLSLDVLLPDSTREVIPIGEMIINSGYNWGTLSLEDVNIDLVYGDLGFDVTVDGWEIKNIKL